MPAIDPPFAQWLQAESDFAVRANQAAIDRWGASAVISSRQTGMATRAAAEAEGDRQLAFFARGPFAIEDHQVTGDHWPGALGRVVTLTGPQLGYDLGIDVFVLEVEEDRSTGVHRIGVLRPLGSA